jgi:hypothetical protein
VLFCPPGGLSETLAFDQRLVLPLPVCVALLDGYGAWLWSPILPHMHTQHKQAAQSCVNTGAVVCYAELHVVCRVLHGTACCAWPDESRFNVTAAQRPNMSTAALERRPAKCARSGGQ